MLSRLLCFAYFKIQLVTRDSSVICFLPCLRSFGVIFITVSLTCLMWFTIHINIALKRNLMILMAAVMYGDVNVFSLGSGRISNLGME